MLGEPKRCCQVAAVDPLPARVGMDTDLFMRIVGASAACSLSIIEFTIPQVVKLSQTAASKAATRSTVRGRAVTWSPKRTSPRARRRGNVSPP